MRKKSHDISIEILGQWNLKLEFGGQRICVFDVQARCT